jgi:YD repeat-containing protein
VEEKRVDFAYNALGQFTGITRYADLAGSDLVATTEYTFDNAHRLTALSHEKGSTVLSDYAWAYDTAGRVTSTVNADGTDTFSYDDNGQLTATDSDYQTDEGFSYDANGNRTNSGYDTGTNNRLLSDGTYDYEYDADGNRTKKTGISSGDYVEYAWDHRNRLVSVTFRNSSDLKAKEVAYKYDASDRRIAKDVVDSPGAPEFNRGGGTSPTARTGLQSTNTNSFRFRITRQAFSIPNSSAYATRESRSSSDGSRLNASQYAAVTRSPVVAPSPVTRPAKCRACATINRLLSNVSAWSGVTVSFRWSTCIEGSAQSSVVMNGCCCERTMNR